MTRSEVKEGKIELKAACDGLFQVDSRRLIAVNSIEDIMIATRKGNTAVKKGDKLAGMRVIPLIIQEEKLKAADEVAYVRFASVYRQFKDINTFMSELNKLLSEK